MEGTNLIVWGFVFGTIGLGFFTYGKKQRALIPFISGLALFIIPYFATNLFILISLGIFFILLPYFIKI